MGSSSSEVNRDSSLDLILFETRLALNVSLHLSFHIKPGSLVCRFRVLLLSFVRGSFKSIVVCRGQWSDSQGTYLPTEKLSMLS